jgi:hypothetical protein
MAPGVYNPTIYQRETWSMQMAFTNPGGGAKDLTGYTAAMEFRDDDDVLLVSPTLTFTAPRTTGILTASLTTAQTLALPQGTAVYDLFLTDVGLVKTPEMYGTVLILPKRTVA